MSWILVTSQFPWFVAVHNLICEFSPLSFRANYLKVKFEHVELEPVGVV